jgi:hypothetical protein
MDPLDRHAGPTGGSSSEDPGREAGRGPPGIRTGAAAFLAIVPGFFVYHTLVNRGLIPAVLGGYSTATALLLLPALSAGYVRRIAASGGSVRELDALFLGFVAYLVIVTAAQLAGGASAEVAIPYFSVAAQFVAAFLAVRLMDLGAVPLRRALVGCFAAVTALALWNATDEAFLRSALDLMISEARMTDYQGYGFVYLVLAVLVVAMARRGVARAAAYLVAVPALFLNGARSEFGGLLVAGLVVEYCYARRRGALVATVAAAAGVLVLAAGPLQGVVEELFPESRFLALADVASDDNASERMRMLASAWRTVRDHPLLGSFASYPPGDYAHNALSAWVDLGLVGFLWYAALVLGPIGILLARFGEDSRRPEYVRALASSVVLLAMAAFAKNFTYVMFPIATALFAQWSPAEEPVPAGAGTALDAPGGSLPGHDPG